jgi:hypothetical protein
MWKPNIVVDEKLKMEVPTPVMKKAEYASVLTSAEVAEYERLAAAVGYEANGYSADEMRLLEVVPAGFYDKNKVHAYLDSQIKRWGWRRLRRVGFVASGSAENGRVLPGPYVKRLPLPVLSTIARVQEVFGDRAEFLISDEMTKADEVSLADLEAQRRAAAQDPFLMVGLRDVSVSRPIAEIVRIVERWDEPAYR